MNEVTRFLNVIEHGDSNAAAQLLPLVYDELRKLAATKMARERPDHTLDATALVHEAYLRLVGDRAYADRRQFCISRATASRYWTYARARLIDAIDGKSE
ncbi:MAG TPA: ECF-type sigma factor [Planctomycetaceae bacterium]|jgi:hypothetical protein|nr:ECF-type sigma factor [Planctomycetaceae bacterium]